MSDHDLRLSDAERELAAADLGEHFAQGRLSVDEHAERLDEVMAARTRGQLTPVFRDLPSPYASRPATAPRVVDDRRGGFGTRLRGLPTPVVVIVALLVGFTVLTNLPIILIGLLVWFFVIGKHRRGGMRRFDRRGGY